MNVPTALVCLGQSACNRSCKVAADEIQANDLLRVWEVHGGRAQGHGVMNGPPQLFAAFRCCRLSLCYRTYHRERHRLRIGERM